MSSSLDLKSADNTALPFESLQSIGNVYAFLDVDHPAVQWAVMRGMLVSSSHVSDSEGFVSFMQAGIIAAGNNARLFNEAIIELYRQKNFQKNQSRMRGMYFFGSRAEAEARINDADWPAYFKPENLVEFDLHCDEMPTVVDANWITFAEVDKSGRIPIDSLGWISRYWEGKQYNDRPVWEVIANGVALVLDENVRRACTLKLERQFADSLIPILMARIASEVGSRGGLIHPFLLRQSENDVFLSYLSSDAEFHDPHIIQRMSEHPDIGKLAEMMRENETWKFPDMRPWFTYYQLGEQQIDDLGGIHIPSVHVNKLASVARVGEATPGASALPACRFAHAGYGRALFKASVARMERGAIRGW